MPQSDPFDEVYEAAKGLRSSETSKRLRRLRGLEGVHYKKTCTVAKRGHNLDESHHLNDGGLRYTVRNLHYSLNKKKRWLLPGIIEQRILERVPSGQASKTSKSDETFSIDDRLKIVMYENENIHHDSTCIRYANSQTEPRVVYKGGRRFNSTTLTKWMDFDQRNRWRAHRRDNETGRVNRPNFGFQQRAGFFPSEVTYEFVYPKRLPTSATYRPGKSTIWYTKDLHERAIRASGDTNKHRRSRQRQHCAAFMHENDFPLEEDLMEEEEEEATIIVTTEMLDENDKWSIVFDDADEEPSASLEFPIDCFIPMSVPSVCTTDIIPLEPMSDRKARKYFEPPAPSPTSGSLSKPSIVNEELLCEIPCSNESDFLTLMQQPALNISQANLSPATFVQRTSSSKFSVVYTYCRTSSKVTVTTKYTGMCPALAADKSTVTLETSVRMVSQMLDARSGESDNKHKTAKDYKVDDLRGSLPVSMSIQRRMVLVQPNSTNRETALHNEHILVDNSSTGQWFDTTSNECDMLECAVCCDVLTANDAHQLLPCQHTLCQTCMISYIRTSVSAATYSSSSCAPISCFQSNCPTQLNAALLQAFLSFDIYQLYVDALLDRRLFSTGKYRKCPSKSCSNLLLVDSHSPVSSMCSCGQRVCLTCFEEYHFPATCRQYRSYASNLRKSGDDLLSVEKGVANSSCYIAEGKNCPNCGEFVEKNGGCPHMTCKCGNEYCWHCLKPWRSHNSANCNNVNESVHELRSSTRNRLYNKAVNHRRQRNQFAFNQLSVTILRSKLCSPHHDLLLSTYIDMNTMAEFLYVLLQRRRTDVFIRAALARTASRLAWEVSQIQLQVERQHIKIDYVNEMRDRLRHTIANLLHMKKIKVLV